MRRLSVLRGVQVVATERDSIAFSSLLLGFDVKNKGLVCNSYFSGSPPYNYISTVQYKLHLSDLPLLKKDIGM
jgi:hypothetical protein